MTRPTPEHILKDYSRILVGVTVVHSTLVDRYRDRESSPNKLVEGELRLAYGALVLEVSYIGAQFDLLRRFSKSSIPDEHKLRFMEEVFHRVNTTSLPDFQKAVDRLVAAFRILDGEIPSPTHNAPGVRQ